MNTDRFDEALRARHAASLDALSPRTRAQLQRRRRAALAGQARDTGAPAWRLAWPIAATCAIGAVVLGLQIRGLETPAPTQVATASTVATPATIAAVPPVDAGAIDDATLEEAPDLYVWLASDDALLAME